MSPTIGLPPPPADAILDGTRTSKYKGGTLVVEEVRTVAEHLARVADPDRYRPESCTRCGHDKLHVHDRVERHPRGDPTLPPVIAVLVFVCASKQCGATWRILPLFLARHLWHPWRVVELKVKPPPASAEHAEPMRDAVSERTERRWRSRLASLGQRLRALLVIAGRVLEEIALRVEQACTREELLDAFIAEVQPRPGERLSGFAAVVHRLERRVRLM